MAFQMIPPRVSSSPPPLDTLPSVTCVGDDDEDEEFGNFTTHSTFDITGLSDKLPPTPERNPTACPGEKKTALSLTNSSGIKGTLKSGGSPLSSVISETCHGNAVVNGEVYSSLKNDDCDEFGDFSFFTSNTPAGETDISGASKKASEEVNPGGVDSSQKCNLAPEVVDSSPNHSVCSYSMIATPPPLDHVVDNIVVDDEFCRISPNPPSVDDDEDDFGDFTACTIDNSKDSSYPIADASRESLTFCEKSLEDGRSNIPDTSGDKPDVIDSVELPGTESPVVSHETSLGDVCESFTQGKSDHCNSDGVTVVDSKTEITNRTSFESCIDDSNERECKLNNDGKTNIYSKNSHCDFGKDSSFHNLAYSGPIADKGTPLEFSLPGVVEEELNSESTGHNSSESCLAQNLSITDESGCELETKNISNATFNEVSACSSSKEGIIRTELIGDKVNKDTNGDEFECNWELRHFDKIEDDDDDDDDLDFGDLREQVRSGKFGLDESADTEDEFGDFYDGTCPAPEVLNQEDDDVEFGEFGTAVTEDENTDEFGDFAQVEPDNDFGNFTSPEGQAFEKGVTNDSAFKKDDDEFGNFTSQQNMENQSDFRVPWHDNVATTPSKDSQVLRKLESLMLKWIPVTISSDNQENKIVPTLFQSVEDDAFVWRQLENLEASTALTLSWGSTQAQTLYLSSVNVDARNILFGQKWSSSVPLFAQTLSFSPLTPAKPTENGSSLEGGNRGSVSPPILSSGIAPKFSASFRKDENEVEITSDNENAPEEQIPPAKFDWTSSGLTNPLEGPAYNSSLFDMDLLLSNSDIGKGATNALLASLEREFLSEGEEKGTIGRIKGPPSPSPLVQQILGSGMNSTQLVATPLQSLSTEIREVVENLPNIGFMRSRVLMFPIRGED